MRIVAAMRGISLFIRITGVIHAVGAPTNQILGTTNPAFHTRIASLGHTGLEHTARLSELPAIGAAEANIQQR